MNYLEYLIGPLDPSIGRRAVDLTVVALPMIRQHLSESRGAIVLGCNNQPGEVVSYIFRASIQKVADIKVGEPTLFFMDFKLVWSKKDQRFDRVAFALPNDKDFSYVTLPEELR